MKTANLGPGIDVDVAQLIKSRLLVQANSGGGKSWTLRRLCEQTFGLVQHIIIDPESEFYTLREKHDYALFGRGGDGPADLKSAPLLARRLLELRLSAVVDISELGVRRPLFVKAFLEALVAVPRELWHPTLIIVDEAHKFCPEKGRGESVSTAAVIDLMTVGRKRGFCGVLATQRVSKLNKDAAAECNNKLIGRCTLDVDRKRAAEEIGFSDKADVLSLRELEAGEFFAYGPALTKTVTQFKVGKVHTTHPEAGEVAPPPVPPRAKVKKMLDELANLPREADEEAKTVSALQQQVKQLQGEVRGLRNTNETLGKHAAHQESIARKKSEPIKEAVPLINHRQVQCIQKITTCITKDTDRLVAAVEHLDKVRDRLAQAQQGVMSEVDNLRREIQLRVKQVEDTNVKATGLPARLVPDALAVAAAQRMKRIGAPPAIGAQQHPPVGYLFKERPVSDGDAKLDGPMLRILGALAWFEAMRIELPDLTAIAFMSGYSGADNGAFNNNRGKLRTMGLVTYPSAGHMALTLEGRSRAPTPDVPQTGEALREAVMSKLDGPGRRILQPLIEAYPNEVSTDDLAVIAGYSGADNGAFNNNRGRLRTLGVVTYPRSGAVRAADVLFPA